LSLIFLLILFSISPKQQQKTGNGLIMKGNVLLVLGEHYLAANDNVEFANKEEQVRFNVTYGCVLLNTLIYDKARSERNKRK
jgi:hypothetical protein